MPAATTQAEKLEREARAKLNLNAALKAHVLKERQRKKEEHEAEIEEERLRKEREARERQDVMTLGETREQISKLEIKLNDLKNEKQSLFLQLKKVLNEDENRKKQQQQKDSEMFAQMHNAPHAQVFLPPRQQNIVKTGIKRARSPSPPQGPQNAYYKGTQYSPKIDDGRRAPDVSRVLWKQPPGQYQNPPGTLFYQTTANPPPNDGRTQQIIYPAYTPIPLRQTYLDIPAQALQQHAQQKADVNQMGHVPQPQQHKPPIITMEKIPDRYHVEVKIERPPSQPTESVVYAPLLHQNMMQQTAKPGVFQTSRPPNNQAQLQQQQLHFPRRLF
ncbi:G protein pathway suppressor 2 [Condylostylus longicornis]|uniref:G protein pathway suppressor 2 n=1 Tax=Condylostylus longicornis TaxID=2530218 RepID=UPI00244DC39B|nr:G protein pathway suppressor 2 [Condylostylus longicornis]